MTYLTAPIERLRQSLRYDAETGKLFWMCRPREHFATDRACGSWNGKYAGTEAGRINASGYSSIGMDGRRYLAHRIVWALHHDEWPSGEIDHINGNPGDNHISNLRVVGRQENCHNTKRRAHNTSGVTGVQRCRDRWAATICVGYRRHHLGYFDDFDSAVAARKAAERLHGFHPNHGRADYADLLREMAA